MTISECKKVTNRLALNFPVQKGTGPGLNTSAPSWVYPAGTYPDDEDYASDPRDEEENLRRWGFQRQEVESVRPDNVRRLGSSTVEHRRRMKVIRVEDDHGFHREARIPVAASLAEKTKPASTAGHCPDWLSDYGAKVATANQNDMRRSVETNCAYVGHFEQSCATAATDRLGHHPGPASFEQCDKRIREILDQLLDAGRALGIVRQQKLWCGSYPNWKSYIDSLDNSDLVRVRNLIEYS